MNSIANESKSFQFYRAASSAVQVKLDILCTDEDKPKTIPDKRVGVWRTVVNLGMSYPPGVAVCPPNDINDVVLIPWPKEEEVLLVSSLKNALGHETVSYTIARNGKRFTYQFK